MIISGTIDTGIPDITVVIRENSDENKLLLNVPNITVNVQKGSNYNVNIQPNSLVVQRTGSLPSLAVSAYSASYALTASYIEGGVGTIDWAEIDNKPSGIVSSSKQYPGWVTASSQVDYNQLKNKPSDIVSSSIQIKNLLPSGTISSSRQYPGWITASSQVDYNELQNKPSASLTASYALNAVSASQASYALTASYVSTSATSWNDVVNKPSGIISSSTQVTTWTVASSSVATSASYAVTASHATNLPTIDIDTYLFTANGVINKFLLSQSYNLNSLEVYVSGAALAPTIEFTISGSTLNLVSVPVSQSKILVRAYVNTTDGSTGTFYGTFNGNLVGSIESASYALTASVAEGFDIIFAGEYETGSTTPLVNGWSPLSASYALTASHINEIVLSTVAPSTPKIGSVYFSSSFIYVYDGIQYRSASLN